MSGVSASTLVIFIASILIAAGVAGTLVTTVGHISTSAETKGDAITDSIDSDIELLNDGGGSEFYTEDDANGTATVTAYARNTGSTTLLKEPTELDVLVNGRFIDAENLTITSMNGDAGRAWATDEVIEIEISLNQQLERSGNRLTVSTNGGAERSVEFTGE